MDPTVPDQEHWFRQKDTLLEGYISDKFLILKIVQCTILATTVTTGAENRPKRSMLEKNISRELYNTKKAI